MELVSILKTPLPVVIVVNKVPPIKKAGLPISGIPIVDKSVATPGGMFTVSVRLKVGLFTVKVLFAQLAETFARVKKVEINGCSEPSMIFVKVKVPVTGPKLAGTVL